MGRAEAAAGSLADDAKSQFGSVGDPGTQAPATAGRGLWRLRATDLDHWRSGWFYNPDDGTTYRVSAELVTQDLLVARIYLGFPLFGRTKVLHRVPHGTSKGWC